MRGSGGAEPRLGSLSNRPSEDGGALAADGGAAAAAAAAAANGGGADGAGEASGAGGARARLDDDTSRARLRVTMDGKQLVTGADARQSRSGGAADSNRSAQRNIVVRRRHTGALSTSNELARAHASVSAMLIKCKEKTRCRSVRMYGLEVRKLFGTCFLIAQPLASTGLIR